MSYIGGEDIGYINNLSFNQDHGCFSCAMDNGIRIYNVEPLREKMHLDSATVGSVALCEMLYRTNIVAIVGGGHKQKYAENTVLLWDNFASKFVAEFTFSSPVLNVRLKRDRLFVAEKTVIHVFNFPNNPRRLYSFDTGINPRGLFQVSPFPSSERQVLVFPGHYAGSIQIVDLSKMNSGTSGAPITISAHDSDVAYIALNQQGTLVATASVKGTLIRVFDTFTKNKIIQLRRGSDPASLYCINFSCDSDYLCASSDKGTIHIFALKRTYLNKRLTFSSAARWMGSYVESQWAFANFTVAQECKCICAFGPNSSVYAICKDGTFHKYVYTNQGSCNRESYDVFLNLCDDCDF
ncbi:WD repeat domain phosphoinositide-interacting protein 4 [Trichonephila clavata]|uniref:WD repeat domain phosphoinositide-interacting protein 4 n=1 Tax=Trichonephila clavata TaxID=2740835 RepID=A0A8X6HEM0_TRICU|nr:WD repeat domain phosphoinositide-interacting protein 4 [Trichonephila clavata]